jgi:hypothetical protein
MVRASAKGEAAMVRKGKAVELCSFLCNEVRKMRKMAAKTLRI